MDPNTEGETEEETGKSRLEEIKYYTSLFLGTLAICCLFAFLFLIPFILDPAISTMYASDYYGFKETFHPVSGCICLLNTQFTVK